MSDFLEQTYWITLAHLPRWGAEKINKLIIKINLKNIDLEKFFDLDETKWKTDFELSSSDIQDLNDAKNNLAKNSFLAESLLSQGFEVIPITSKNYPKILKANLKTKFSPPVIYTKGNTQIFEENSIAIVGSRDASEISLKFTDNIARLASKDFKVVVSGFAKGVDQQALDSAIKYVGRSIIVLPQGILTFTSGMNKYYKQIVEGNVVVLSTFHPNSVWSTGLAMARNPIIYGLAKDIYVAQSSNKGGTWEGVRKGLKMGRVIYVRQPNSDENNSNFELIKLGANPVDFDGRQLESYSSEISKVQLVMESLEKEVPPGLKEILELLKNAKGALSAKEISNSLSNKINSKKISSLLNNEEGVSKVKGKPIRYHIPKDHESLFCGIEDEKIPVMKLTNTTDEVINNAEIEVLKIDFDNFSNWEFRYRGERLLAQIVDINFIQKVNNTIYGFAKGDKLVADIKRVKNSSAIEITNIVDLKLKYKE